MGRPPKSYLQLVNEGKTHLTKEQIESRKSQEEALLSKTKIKEFKDVKDNIVAHKEFLRITGLLKKINKNDDLFAGPINRYSLLKAECDRFEEEREGYCSSLNQLEYEYKEQERENPIISTLDYLHMRTTIQSQLIALDKLVQAKRKMMLDIEKENLMTIASALRSIPKRIEANEEKVSEEELLFGGNL